MKSRRWESRTENLSLHVGRRLHFVWSQLSLSLSLTVSDSRGSFPEFGEPIRGSSSACLCSHFSSAHCLFGGNWERNASPPFSFFFSPFFFLPLFFCLSELGPKEAEFSLENLVQFFCVVIALTCYWKTWVCVSRELWLVTSRLVWPRRPLARPQEEKPPV